MKCPKCGRVIEDHSVFCEYCGHKIKKAKWPWLILVGAVLIGVIVAVVMANNNKHIALSREEESLYKNCQTAADYRYYLSVYPDGRFATMARNKVEEMTQDSVRQQLDLKAAERNFYENCVSQRDCRAYLERYPRGEYVSQVSQLLNRLQQDSLNRMQLQEEDVYDEVLSSSDMGESSRANKTTTRDGFNVTINGISYVMKKVEGGTFSMGSNDAAYKWENPAHSVTVSSYYIGETEVTQDLWNAVLGNNPSYFIGGNLPVDNVSYNDIVNEFLPRLNQLTGKNFRLPTEAEWEFAARGGKHSRNNDYAGSNNIGNVAWYWQNTGDQFLGGTDEEWNWDIIVENNGRTRDVKGKSPNELGLYDMSGNVWEWCSDAWYQYKGYSENNPRHAGDANSNHVLRGGCWCSRSKDCRVTFRSGKKPYEHYNKWGFRLAFSN